MTDWTPRRRAAYHERVIAQTRRWVNGQPMHNRVDNECCPDFSCCRPELFTTDRDDREEELARLLRQYSKGN